LGVHAVSAEEENLLSLFMKTDQALYQAKQAGRNRVAIKKD
jgi:PleD family two-component response regulator